MDSDNAENYRPVQRDDKYSLKFVLFSNVVSFICGLGMHYLTDHH